MQYVINVILMGVAGMFVTVLAVALISWFVMIVFKAATLGIYFGIESYEETKLKKKEKDNGRSN